MRKNLTLTAIVSVFWISMGTWGLSKYMCDPTNGISGISISDGNTTFETEDHFMFKVSSSQLLLEPGAEKIFRQLASYLHANPTKSLMLNGFYTAEELNISEFESLGKARAESLKAKLSHYGAPDIQLQTSGTTVDMSVLSRDHLVNGISFKFGELNTISDNTPFDPSDPELPMAPERENIESRIIHGDAIQNMALNPANQHYIDKVRSFLDEHPDYQLEIVGHTQEMGSPSMNAKQSIDFARTVRKFFIKNKVDKDRIKFTGKGASEFMVGPKHPDAEIKNNRVEIEVVEKSN